MARNTAASAASHQGETPPGPNVMQSQSDRKQTQPEAEIAQRAERSGMGEFNGFEMGESGLVGLARVQYLAPTEFYRSKAENPRFPDRKFQRPAPHPLS